MVDKPFTYLTRLFGKTTESASVVLDHDRVLFETRFQLIETGLVFEFRIRGGCGSLAAGEGNERAI